MPFSILKRFLHLESLHQSKSLAFWKWIHCKILNIIIKRCPQLYDHGHICYERTHQLPYLICVCGYLKRMCSSFLVSRFTYKQFDPASRRKWIERSDSVLFDNGTMKCVLLTFLSISIKDMKVKVKIWLTVSNQLSNSLHWFVVT